MSTTWTISIDWERDGNYTGQYDDVTDRVVAAQWFLGMRQPYQDTADNLALSLTLKNDDRLFSPEYSGSPLSGKLVPFRPVRIQSDDGSTVRTHWTGWVESIQPDVNQYGQRLVSIVGLGAMQQLKAAETTTALQLNKRTDEIISELIGEVVTLPGSILEQGKTTLDVAADNWVTQGGATDIQQDTFNIYHAIGDVTAAERGRFYFDREGQARFWNRHHLLEGGTPVATFDDAMNDMVYTFAGLELCKNEIIAVGHPRDFSASTTDELWKLPQGEAVFLPIGEPRTYYVKYKDENGNRIGAMDVTVTGVVCLQGSASVAVDPKANGADLTFTNTGQVQAVVTGCVLQGRKITDYGWIEAKATDDDSITEYGRRTLRINLPTIDNNGDAFQIAHFELARRSEPRGAVGSLTVVSHGTNGGLQHSSQLALTIGDLITIEETQTAHQGQYYIVGEYHELSMGKTLLRTTWYLEPAPLQYPWKLGVVGRAELGEHTFLTY